MNTSTTREIDQWSGNDASAYKGGESHEILRKDVIKVYVGRWSMQRTMNTKMVDSNNSSENIGETSCTDIISILSRNDMTREKGKLFPDRLRVQQKTKQTVHTKIQRHVLNFYEAQQKLRNAAPASHWVKKPSKSSNSQAPKFPRSSTARKIDFNDSCEKTMTNPVICSEINNRVNEQVECSEILKLLKISDENESYENQGNESLLHSDKFELYISDYDMSTNELEKRFLEKLKVLRIPTRKHKKKSGIPECDRLRMIILLKNTIKHMRRNHVNSMPRLNWSCSY